MTDLIKVKYIPTGIIFDLPKEDVDTLKNASLSDSHNFEVLSDDYVAPKTDEIEDETVLAQVIEKPVDEMNINELREYAKQNNIDIKGLKTKADILAKIKG